MSQGGVYGGEFTATFQMCVDQELDDERVAFYITELFNADVDDPEANWQIVLNCPGGTTESGTALYETIRSYSKRGGGTHFITIIAAGQCSSMATLVLQAGDWRVVGRMTYCLFHEPTAGSDGGSMAEVRADIEMIEEWNYLADKATLERSTLPLAQFRKRIATKPWILFGEDMLSHGFCDELR